MGKIKNRRQGKQQRNHPVGEPLEESEGQTLEDSSTTVYVQNIYDQLKSYLPEERDNGLNSLSIACQNPSLIDEILANDLVKIAGALLIDPSASVRHSAAGALRNLSSLSSTVSDLMVTQDVMTPLITLLKERYQNDWTVQPKSEGLKIDTVTETFEEAVTLLWNLCESSETALKIFNRENIVPLISKCLNVDAYGVKAAIVVAQCLYTVTEDNCDSLPDCGEFELCLQKILRREGEEWKYWNHLKMLSIGIILNLHNGHISKLSPEDITLTMNILCSILDVDHLSEVNRYSSDVPVRTLNGVEQINKLPDEDSHPKDEIDVKKIIELDKSLDKLHNVLSSQILALEILSNLIFTEDDDADSYDDDSEESVTEFNDEMDTCALDTEMESVSHGLPSEVYEVIVSQKVVNKVISKLRLPPANVMQILTDSREYGGKIIEKVSQLSCTSLLCFQNLIAGLDINDMGFDPLKSVWISLGTLLVQSGTSNVDFVEANTSAMRALVQKMVEEKSHQIVETMTVVDLNVFYEVYANVPEPKVQVNLIKIISGIGVLLANKQSGSTLPDLEPLIGQVGDFLISHLGSPTEKGNLWIAAEVLDSLFDVFSEDNYNHVMKQLGIIEKLKIFSPHFKKQIQNQRRNLGENKAIIQTARTNLSRFIEYKIKHGAT